MECGREKVNRHDEIKHQNHDHGIHKPLHKNQPTMIIKVPKKILKIVIKIDLFKNKSIKFPNIKCPTINPPHVFSPTQTRFSLYSFLTSFLSLHIPFFLA